MTTMFIIGTVICALSTLICWTMTALRSHPADSITGEAWEFWGYILTALLLPVGVFIWAIIDKTRWSNLVMSFVGLVVLVMVYRLEEIWWGSAL